MKKILSTLIALTIIASSTICANAETIDVTLNSVNLSVNEKIIQTPNILWNGTTYVPLRAVSDNLGCDVTWDEATRTAYVSNIGQMCLFDSLNSLSRYRTSLNGVNSEIIHNLDAYYNSVIFNAKNKDEFRQTALDSINDMYNYLPEWTLEGMVQINKSMYLELLIASSISGFSMEQFDTSVSNLFTALENCELAIESIDNYRESLQLIYLSNYGTYTQTAKSYFKDSLNVSSNFIDSINNAYKKLVLSSN